MPACQVAAPITPMSMPLVTIIQMVPIPAVIPMANVAKDTARLLVIMPEAARGLIVTMDCVHISFFSMVSIICGPSKRCAKLGSWIVTAHVAIPVAAKIRKASKDRRNVSRKSLRIKTYDAADFLHVTHVDEIVSAPKKLIQVEGQLIAGHIFAHGGEVRGRLAVQ